MSNTADLQRAYRARQRCGVILLRVPVVENDLAEALIASERLSAEKSCDRMKLAKEAGDVLAEWISRWLKK